MISTSPFDGGSRGLNPCRVTFLNPDTLSCVRVLLFKQIINNMKIFKKCGIKNKVMEKQFVTYEIALKLKELGFDESCLAVYFKDKFQLVKGFNINNVDLHVANEFGGILAPLWQQVIDFFRNEYNMIISISPFEDFSERYLNNWINLRTIHYRYDISIINERLIDDETINKARIMIGDESEDKLIFIDKKLEVISFGNENNYYDAIKQAILKAIELCQNKK